MKFTKVEGKNIGEIKIYTLSTCGWCKKTKKLLNNAGIEYYYIDVDLLEEPELSEISKEQEKFNPAGSFPTVVCADGNIIIGYDEEKLNSLIK